MKKEWSISIINSDSAFVGLDSKKLAIIESVLQSLKIPYKVMMDFEICKNGKKKYCR